MTSKIVSLPIAFALTIISASAWAACNCNSNADCFAGYYCKPVPNGCGNDAFTGWCTSPGSHRSGSGVETPDVPLKAPGAPSPDRSERVTQ